MSSKYKESVLKNGEELCRELVSDSSIDTVGILDDDGNTIASKGFNITPQEFHDIKFILINEKPDYKLGTVTINHVTYNELTKYCDNLYYAKAAETGCIIAKNTKSIIIATLHCKHTSTLFNACDKVKSTSQFIKIEGY
ncbi:hypothetical protein RB653_007055 [Dictyostelium firmibasis]|uniref:Profilin n=1 Tax=Dictyostelium firmibasis TaxID=79012 RepID=A0AAN7TVY3_9MYCE